MYDAPAYIPANALVQVNAVTVVYFYILCCFNMIASDSSSTPLCYEGDTQRRVQGLYIT